MGKLTVETQTEVVILPISAFYHKSLDGWVESLFQHFCIFIPGFSHLVKDFHTD